MNIPIVTPVFAWLMKLIMQIVKGGNGVHFAWAIILFTVAVKLILFPLQLKSKKGMIDQQRIAPKLKKLEKKYGSNKQKYQEEVSKLYKEENVSMMGGCLPSLLTLVIILGLYTVIYRPLTHLMNFNKGSTQVYEIAQDLVELKNDGTYLLKDGNRADYEAKGLAAEYDEEIAKLFQVDNKKGFLVQLDSAAKNVEKSDKTINQLTVARLLYRNIGSLTAKLDAEKLACEAEGKTWEAPYSTEKLFDINFNMFGLDLGDMPSYKPMNILVILPILSGITAFFLSWVNKVYQQKITGKKKSSSTASSGNGGLADNAEQTTNMMMYLMPITSVFIGFMLPAGITVYWIVNNLLSAAQEPILQLVCEKHYHITFPVVAESDKKKAPVKTAEPEKKKISEKTETVKETEDDDDDGDYYVSTVKEEESSEDTGYETEDPDTEGSDKKSSEESDE